MTTGAPQEHSHPTPFVHQILITDGVGDLRQLPTSLESNRQQLLSLYPKAHHKTWLKEDLREFLAQSFDAPVLKTFDMLKPYAFKADLARYCLLYKTGGLYADLAIRLVRTWDVPVEFGFSAFKELNFSSLSWSVVQNGLIWSLPSRRELAIAIDWIVENCQNMYYGRGALYPTGPVMFGRAIIAAMAEAGQSDAADDQWIGEYRWVTPEGAMKNDAYVAPDHSVVAFRTKLIPGDFRHLGLVGTNNYNTIWSQRQIYSEKSKVWDCTKAPMRNRGLLTDAGISAPDGFSGHLLWGPYLDLPAGTYRLTVNLAGETIRGRLGVDAAIRSGGEVLNQTQRVFGPGDANKHMALQFSLPSRGAEIEFRVEASGNFEGSVASMELTPLSYLSRKWEGGHPSLRLLQAKVVDNAMIVALEAVGRVSYGPYEPIDEGKYEFEVTFTEGTEFADIRIEITALVGEKSLFVFESRSESVTVHEQIAFNFEIENDYDEFEFLVDVFGDFAGGIQLFELRHVV